MYITFVVNTLLSIYFFYVTIVIYTFTVNDLIENGTKSSIFLFQSPAHHSRDHLKNKYVASGDVRLFHVEPSGKLTPK